MKSMENCIFCKIVAGEIPSPRLFEDEQMIVIRDIEPKAKLHYLCIPKTHFSTLAEQYGLIVTGGSDFHAPSLNHGTILMGKNFVPDWVYDKLIREKKRIELAN